jgi:hypothetical protein
MAFAQNIDGKKHKYYVLEQVRRNRNNAEYTRWVDNIFADSDEEAAEVLAKVYGNKFSIQRANPGYKEGR